MQETLLAAWRSLDGFEAFGRDPIQPGAQRGIVRAYGLMVLTPDQDRISAITWFGERSLFPHFGMPRTLPE